MSRSPTPEVGRLPRQVARRVRFPARSFVDDVDDEMEKLHYHLIGIAGTAMASVAGLLRSAGHQVTGSDEGVYPPMSDQLRALGIPYAEGYTPDNLRMGRRERPDVVVVGNAISRGNPELEAVLDEGLPYTSAAAVVKEN